MHKIEQITTAEVARELGVDRTTVNRLVARKVLTPLQKLPGKTGAYLFNHADVEALAAERASRDGKRKAPRQNHEARRGAYNPPLTTPKGGQ